jgi:ABC-type transporter lipoprotein component MlaA
VLPVLGPTTVRDGTGDAVDLLFRPTTYLLTPAGTVLVVPLVTPADAVANTVLQGSTELASGIATRDAVGDSLAALEVSSIDFYAALRNAYYQTRVASIWRRGEEHEPLAIARHALGAFALRASGREVGDLGPDGREKGVEAVALQH